MKVKQLLSLLLALVLSASLCACGSGGGSSSAPAVSEEPSVSAMAPAEPDPVPEPQPEPIPEPEPEPEPEPVLPFVNPLTGEGCETDIGANRPIAIMLNNHEKARPQLGVSQADIIYEMVAEGGITRMMGVFQSVEGVGNIGTVRSARDYYVSLAYGHDAIFLHAGGSPMAYTVIKQWGITALDCVNGPYEGTLFWRDQARRKSAGLEHSVLTSGDTILKLLPTYKRVTMTHKEGYDPGLDFLPAGQTAQGEPVSTVTVKFSNYKTGIFTYDPDSGRYLISEGSKPYLDGNTGEQVSVKNVLVLHTDVSAIKGDDKGRQSLRTTGTGKGTLFCDGVQQEITWSKKNHSSPMTYTLADGSPALLGVGTTYVNIIGSSSKLTVT